MEELDRERFEDVLERLSTEAGSFGLEVSPFKAGWYNRAVSNEKFRLANLEEDSLCFVVISTPAMFEKAFLPFVAGQGSPDKSEDQSEMRDPLDRCMRHHFARMVGLFSAESWGAAAEAALDFEVSPITRRPKVLVQTAGHVSGAVRLFRKADVGELPVAVSLDGETIVIDEQTRLHPVCVHPRHGGWFGLRGVIAFPRAKAGSYLQRKDPPAILESRADVAKLLYLFNKRWADNRYRELGIPEGLKHVSTTRYSDLQRTYFGLKPCQRWPLIRDIRQRYREMGETTALAPVAPMASNWVPPATG